LDPLYRAFAVLLAFATLGGCSHANPRRGTIRTGCAEPPNGSSVLTQKFAYEISLVFSAGSSLLFGHNATALLLIAPRSDQKSFAIFRKELLGQHTRNSRYVDPAIDRESAAAPIVPLGWPRTSYAMRDDLRGVRPEPVPPTSATSTAGTSRRAERSSLTARRRCVPVRAGGYRIANEL